MTDRIDNINTEDASTVQVAEECPLDELSLEEFKERLGWFFKAYDLEGDLKFYSQAEWKARKEEVCDDAILHLISEGPLYSLCNGPTYYNDLLRDFGIYHGWYVEQGYAWSWHFMPFSSMKFNEDFNEIIDDSDSPDGEVDSGSFPF